MMEVHDTLWYSRKPRFKEQVEEHLANLLSISVSRAELSEKGYEYALALQTEQQQRGDAVTATMMARAAELVREALPGAYRLYELRNRMR